MGDSVDRVLAQWERERPDLDASPMGIVGRIQRASRLLDRGLQEFFGPHELQLWEFDILATLRRSGRLTAGELVTASMITSGALTNRIDRLLARGLVSRQTDPDNRRSVLVELTEAGRDLVEELLVGHVANETRLLAALSPARRSELAELLRTLLISLGDVPAETAGT